MLIKISQLIENQYFTLIYRVNEKSFYNMFSTLKHYSHSLRSCEKEAEYFRFRQSPKSEIHSPLFCERSEQKTYYKNDFSFTLYQTITS
jgi:hypothetical protein